MSWTSLAFLFTLCLPELISGQDHPCPKTGSGFYPDPEQCDKYWECRKGKPTPKFCPDGLVFNPQSPLYERCQYTFNIDCTDRPYLQEAHPKRHCPRSNGLYRVEDDCSAFWQCNGGLARKIRCQGTLAFNPKTGTCQWPHLVPGCDGPEGQPGVIGEVDDDGPTVTTTAKPQPPPSRGRTPSRGRRPQTPEPTAAPTESSRPQSRSSRGQNRNRQQLAPQTPPAPRAPVPPPQEAAPALGPLPVPFQPSVRRQPAPSSETPEEPNPQNLPLPVPFPPTSGVRRIPSYSQPQRNSDAASEDKPAEPAPARSQGPPPRRGAANSLRGATEPTTDPAASDAPAVQPPPVRRVVFRRPITTTQAAPSDDYSYDDFSN